MSQHIWHRQSLQYAALALRRPGFRSMNVNYIVRGLHCAQQGRRSSYTATRNAQHDAGWQGELFAQAAGLTDEGDGRARQLIFLVPLAECWTAMPACYI